jgi:hypothetical protein
METLKQVSLTWFRAAAAAAIALYLAGETDFKTLGMQPSQGSSGLYLSGSTHLLLSLAEASE